MTRAGPAPPPLGARALGGWGYDWHDWPYPPFPCGIQSSRDGGTTRGTTGRIGARLAREQVLQVEVPQGVGHLGQRPRPVVVAVDVGPGGERRVRVAEPGGEGHGVHLGARTEQGRVRMAEGVPGHALHARSLRNAAQAIARCPVAAVRVPLRVREYRGTLGPLGGLPVGYQDGGEALADGNVADLLGAFLYNATLVGVHWRNTTCPDGTATNTGCPVA